MNKLLPVLIAAMFSASTFSVVAANTTAPGVGAETSKTHTVKPANAKKYQNEGKSREMKEEKGENRKHEMKETKAQEMKEK